MERQHYVYYLIRVKSAKANAADERWRYVCYKYNNDILVDNATDATSFEHQPVETMIRVYQQCLRKYQRDVEYVKLTVNLEIDIVDLNQDVYLEQRRRVALQKLNEDDIRALGIESLAVYNKLRNHPEKV